MFDFLNRLFDWLFQFVPQFGIIGPHEKAVRITCIPFIHKWCKIRDFGWYCYWPLFQEVHYLNAKPQILMIEVTREYENKTIVSTWVIQYWIQDVYKAIFEVEDFEERLASQSAKVIGTCLEEGKKPDENSLSEIRRGMSGFGVYIQEFYPLQFSRVRPMKIYMENIGRNYGRVIGGE